MLGGVRTPWKRARHGTKPDVRLVSVPHRNWVRSRPCVIKGLSANGIPHRCDGNMHCAHFRLGTGGGTSRKPDDLWSFPACWLAHLQQHAIGEPEFQRMWGLDLRAICLDLAKRSPCRKTREAAEKMRLLDQLSEQTQRRVG